MVIGGEGGSRTLGTRKGSLDLLQAPAFRPSGHQQKTLMFKFVPDKFVESSTFGSLRDYRMQIKYLVGMQKKKWRRERDSNPRNYK